MFNDSSFSQNLPKATAALPLSFLDRSPAKRRKFGGSLAGGLGGGVEDQLVDTLFDRLTTLRHPALAADAHWVAHSGPDLGPQDGAVSFAAKAQALRLAKAERARQVAQTTPAPAALPVTPAENDPTARPIRAALYPAKETPAKPALKLRLASSVMDLSALVICPPVGVAMLGVSLWRGSDVNTSGRVLALTGTLIGLANLALTGPFSSLL